MELVSSVKLSAFLVHYMISPVTNILIIDTLKIFNDNVPLPIIDLVKTRHSYLNIRTDDNRVFEKAKKPIGVGLFPFSIQVRWTILRRPDLLH